MKLSSLFSLTSLFFAGQAFAGSIDVSCSSPDQQIFVNRKEVRVKTESYKHDGVNDVINLDILGETVNLTLSKKDSKPTRIKMSLLAEKELDYTSSTRADCRDVSDTWTSVRYTLNSKIVDIPKSGLLICKIHILTTTGGGHCH